ncbi:MAG: hypothetical protein VX257_09760, partial [Planctomycetota bacterium]|nr:hypothetical protein [Planctomycetota bacterium]
LRGAMLSEPADAASQSLREAVVANLAATASAVESPAGPRSGRSRSNVFGIAIAAGLLVGLTVGVLVLQNIWSPAGPVAEVRDGDGGTDGATATTGSEEKVAKSRSYGEHSELEEEARRRVTAELGDEANAEVPAEWYGNGTSQSVVGGHGRAEPSERFFEDLRRGGQGQSRPGRRPQPKFAEEGAEDFEAELIESSVDKLETNDPLADRVRSGRLQNQTRLGLSDQGGRPVPHPGGLDSHSNEKTDDESEPDDRDAQSIGESLNAGKAKEIFGKRDGDKDEERLNDQADRQKTATAAERKTAEAGKVKQLIDGWRRSRKLPNTSRLMIGDREELPLQGMQVNVQIDGFRARVLLDLYYLNTHPRQLEGNFQ